MRRRLGEFENQLPDLLITIAASLKAGHSFKQGVQAVVDEGHAAGVGRVQARASPRPASAGRWTTRSREMADRLGSENFEFAITAVTIQRQVGGSLASLFDMVADTVRQRQQFARKVRSLTAMGRMSAYTLIGLPFFIALAISVLNPGYLNPLYPHARQGIMLLGVGLAMMAPAPCSSTRSSRSRVDADASRSQPPSVSSLSALAVGNLATHARTRPPRAHPLGSDVRARQGRPRGRSACSSASESSDRSSRRSHAAMLRLNPKQDLESLAKLLMSAGLRNVSPQTFLAIKAAAGGSGLALGFAVGCELVAERRRSCSASCSARSATSRLRHDRVGTRAAGARRCSRSELPDALDLLAVSVEAGLGFDGAVSKLTQYMDGPLVEEFELVLGGMRIGESRADALKKLADRAGAPEVVAFVRAIIQADQLGTSLGRILRVQAWTRG